MTQTATTAAHPAMAQELRSLTEGDLIFGLAPETFESLSAEDQAKARKDFLNNQEPKVFDVQISVFNGMQPGQQQAIIEDYIDSKQRPIANMPPRQFFALSHEERMKAFETHQAKITNDFQAEKIGMRYSLIGFIFFFAAATGSCDYIFGRDKTPAPAPQKTFISAAPQPSK